MEKKTELLECQLIEERAAYMAVGSWLNRSEAVYAFLESKGISVDEAKTILNDRTTEPPPEFVEEEKKRIISKILERT